MPEIIKEAAAKVGGAASTAFAFDLAGISWWSVGIATSIAGVAGLALAFSRYAEDDHYSRRMWIRDFVIGALAGFMVLMLLSRSGLDKEAILGLMVVAGWSGQWVLDRGKNLIARMFPEVK